MKRVCIVGAGAIGGFVGTKLAASGQAEVSALARGQTLHALRERGWRLQTDVELVQAPAIASDRAEELGVQDIVVIAVKGPALPTVATQIGPLIGPDTLIVPMMNGVPWWFSDGVQALNGNRLESVDPGGVVAASIPQRQIVGAVVHASTSTTEPGLVLHKMGRGLILGEPQGGLSQRVQDIVLLLEHAGFDVKHSDSIRQDIWYKLWGNLTLNPVSAVTGATSDRVLGDPLLRQFCTRAMEEAALIGASIGCVIEQGPEDRHAITAKLGAFKTSMLQDVEGQRAIELDSIVTAVHELGRCLGIETPNIDALLGMTRVFARTRGLYPEQV
ncbi:MULTISPECIES: 2-dehydropantoate 2-reductase [unclassified Burkholderia]|uniref:2-dehydropantoate 2-reductase n=1 Tax=unclassified Burkholderia TaxID=2613784 RepID=UPI0005CF1AD6|nr:MULTISPECIES: 2-dehydropantoate 2-reductase [unclassified Burkholderia]TGN98719.1 2-dehydropantoate 2-reductase [Burkholderia sp. USMB20]